MSAWLLNHEEKHPTYFDFKYFSIDFENQILQYLFTIISENGAGGPNNCYMGNLSLLLTMRWRHPPAINDVDNINTHPGRLGTVYVLNYHVKFGMEPRKINYSINFGQFV